MAVPALHLSLGIFCRLFFLFEQECQRLDGAWGQKNIADRAARMAAATEAEASRDLLLQHVTWAHLNSDPKNQDVQLLRGAVVHFQEKAKSLVGQAKILHNN